MKRCFFLIFFLASCSINETKNTPLFIAADSSSFVILDKNKFSGEGFEIGTTDVNIKQWDGIVPGATQTWVPIQTSRG